MSIANRFGRLCKMTQAKLKEYLASELIEYGYEVVNEDGFLYAKGEIPILLTAHMDTVHKVTCRHYKIQRIKGSEIVCSKDGIGGDDRCGIFMTLEIIKDGYRPSILFCEDEEIGRVGAKKFCATKWIDELKELKYLIELDRMNSSDAVFYECDNPEFTKYITEKIKYKEDFGSYSDISSLSPACGVASVNLSCGYYNAHTTKEYVVVDEMMYTTAAVKFLLDDVDACDKFEFIERENNWGLYNYNYGYGYGYGYGYNYGNSEDEINGIEVIYVTKNGTQETGFGYGESESEAFLDFFMTYKKVCFDDILDYSLY